jgi:hypothetical protein
MQYSQKQQFHARDYSFRPTTLADALVAAGVTEKPHLVRERRVEAVVRQRDDRDNVDESVVVPLAVRTPGAFGGQKKADFR